MNLITDFMGNLDYSEQIAERIGKFQERKNDLNYSFANPQAQEQVNALKEAWKMTKGWAAVSIAALPINFAANFWVNSYTYGKDFALSNSGMLGSAATVILASGIIIVLAADNFTNLPRDAIEREREVTARHVKSAKSAVPTGEVIES